MRNILLTLALWTTSLASLASLPEQGLYPGGVA